MNQLAMSCEFSKSSIEVVAPSNIAWVKYWGKKNLQVGINPSISMPLKNCYTRSKIKFDLSKEERNSESPSVSLVFEDREQKDFLPKIETFLKRTRDLYPILNRLKSIDITSENTFPHSSGIASSASAFSALALALEELQAKYEGKEKDLERASNAARLGSGSACRSFYDGFSLWGRNALEGRDDHAVRLKDVDPIFSRVYDAICIVSSSKKAVGSSEGHALMNDHIYKNSRIKQAKENCEKLIAALQNGAIDAAGEVLEEEALALHSLMSTSRPSFILLRPNTIAIIEAVRSFRLSKGCPVYFTLDAGPNPHVIYFEKSKSMVEDELLPELKKLCENERIIADEIGQGARVIESFFGGDE